MKVQAHHHTVLSPQTEPAYDVAVRFLKPSQMEAIKDGGCTATDLKAISVWDELDWILLTKLVLLEHLAVLKKGIQRQSKILTKFD